MEATSAAASSSSGTAQQLLESLAAISLQQTPNEVRHKQFECLSFVLQNCACGSSSSSSGGAATAAPAAAPAGIGALALASPGGGAGALAAASSAPWTSESWRTVLTIIGTINNSNTYERL